MAIVFPLCRFYVLSFFLSSSSSYSTKTVVLTLFYVLSFFLSFFLRPLLQDCFPPFSILPTFFLFFPFSFLLFRSSSFSGLKLFPHMSSLPSFFLVFVLSFFVLFFRTKTVFLLSHFYLLSFFVFFFRAKTVFLLSFSLLYVLSFFL